MNKLEESIKRFEESQPFDPFTFSAKHPERATKEYDPKLAEKSEPVDYDKLCHNALNKLRTS